MAALKYPKTKGIVKFTQSLKETVKAIPRLPSEVCMRPESAANSIASINLDAKTRVMRITENLYAAFTPAGSGNGLLKTSPLLVDEVKPKKRRRRLGHFTLVELLVVIAIIAILMSFLLPALRSAKNLTQAIACAGNLKQIGLAALCYETDFNGYMPVAIERSNSNDPAWFVNSLPPYLSMKPLGDNAIRGLGKSSVLTCPSQYAIVNQLRTYAENASLFGGFFTKVASDYSPVRKDWVLNQPYRASRMPVLSSTIPYFVDGFYYSTSANPYFAYFRNLDQGDGFDVTTLNGSANSLPHNRSANIVFLDGHATRTSYSDDTWKQAKRPFITSSGVELW